MEKDKIRVLVISASPRKNGNTAYLANRVMEEVTVQKFPAEAEYYSFAGKKLNPCLGCLKCYTNKGGCVWIDDFADLREKWLKSDVIIYVVPVYVVGIPGQLKCFIDRLHNSLFGYYPDSSMRHMKVIGAITQGGDFGGGQELSAVDIMRHAALINSIYVAPDGSYINCSGWADGPDGVEVKRKIGEETPDAVITRDTMKSVVKRCVEVAYVIRKGMEAVLPEVKDDIKYFAYQEHLK